MISYETDKTHKEKLNEKYNKKEEEKEKIEHHKNMIYDDYELNNMDYQDASINDKRSCLRTYWSVLKRENSFLFTFIACNDYNLFYVKIERLFLLICTQMTVNGLFFVHESMYKKNMQSEDFTFVQKLPQLIFTILVSDAIEVILCFLSMTDKHIYDVKALVRDQKEKNKKEKNDINDKKELGQKIMNILDVMKRKLVSFFVFTFLLCLFIYGITNILRAISLSLCCRKKLGCVYKISDLIPIF